MAYSKVYNPFVGKLDYVGVSLGDLPAHATIHEVGGSDLINHDNLTGFAANEHIDWTAAVDAFLTTNSGTFGGLLDKVQLTALGKSGQLNDIVQFKIGSTLFWSMNKNGIWTGANLTATTQINTPKIIDSGGSITIDATGIGGTYVNITNSTIGAAAKTALQKDGVEIVGVDDVVNASVIEDSFLKNYLHKLRQIF